jgi:nitrite reductase/ring-hydroxylating ferredoxin subunit
MIPLCSLTQLEEGTCLTFDVAMKSVFVVKKDGHVFGYQNYCPHLGVRLEFQENDFLDPEGKFILCANHGALFHIEDGFCVSGPCSGKSLKKLNLKIENEYIYLTEAPL